MFRLLLILHILKKGTFMKNTVKTIRNRILSLFIITAIISLSGCTNSVMPSSAAPTQGSTTELPQITICLDPLANSDLRKAELRSSLKNIPGYMESFTIDIEAVPGGVILSEGEVGIRDNSLMRIRTEMMAGAGPDLFICGCPRPSRGTKRTVPKGLFPYPASAMKSNLFLPLDDFIKNTSAIEWDSLVPQVMDAGKYKDTQFIAPLTYVFGITGFDSAQHSIEDTSPITWEEQIASGSDEIRWAGHTNDIFSIFGNLADYERDVLTFSEEDLLFCLKNLLAPLDIPEEGAPETMAGLPIGLPNMVDNKGNCSFGDKSPEYIFIPQYNTAGGVTAQVTSFAAINRNTDNPEEAFAIIELLLSKEGQQNTELYDSLYGMPTHMELGSKGAPAQSLGGPWHMSDENFKAFCKVREQINAVNFFTPLEEEIDKMLWSCFETELSDNELEELVSDTYRVMTMMIGES